MIKHGVCAIISRINKTGQKEYLLIQAKKDRGEHTGKWYPPGGWIDKDEKEDNAVCRECREELSLEVKAIRKITEIPGDIENLTLHFWQCHIILGEIHMNGELTAVGWFKAADLKSMHLYPATYKVLKEYLHEDI